MCGRKVQQKIIRAYSVRTMELLIPRDDGRRGEGPRWASESSCRSSCWRSCSCSSSTQNLGVGDAQYRL